MTTLIAVLLTLAFAYVVFVAWARRQGRQVFYHATWSPFFRFFTGGQMEAITLWNWTILLLGVTPLTAAGFKHENVHVGQFAANPHGFPFLYLWALARYGYDANPYEVAARAAEGV